MPSKHDTIIKTNETTRKLVLVKKKLMTTYDNKFTYTTFTVVNIDSIITITLRKI